MIERLTDGDTFAREIGCRLVEIREGYARACLTVDERHINAAGVCQGGVIFTLADLAFAAVSNSHGILSVGINNSISYVRSARLGETITAECTEVVNHHKLPNSEIKVTNSAGDIVAVMSATAYRTSKPFDFDTLM